MLTYVIKWFIIFTQGAMFFSSAAISTTNVIRRSHCHFYKHNYHS